MKVLIRQTRIISPSSPLNGQLKDILVTDGIITTIADKINEKADQVIALQGLCVSAGWMDPFAHFCDPGFENRETIESGMAAAAAGGFTDVMLIPNTNPVIHSKSQVEYLLNKSAEGPVQLHPIGAVTSNAAGATLAEMYDMRQSGAIAFSDGINPVQSPGILLKALQYIKAFDGTLIQVPCDNSIAPHGLMNEGLVSTKLGLPGIPAIAEELMIIRDIELTRYTGSKMHITGVSTQKGLELIADARDNGLKVTCSITPYHAFFCDEDLVDYDTNLKTAPPLRTRADMIFLRDALMDGMIDCIASHHLPHDNDQKACEFEYAKNGMTGLETMFGVMNTIGVKPEEFVRMQTEAVRTIFGLPVPLIEEGSPACLTLFDPEPVIQIDPGTLQSRSGNTPFAGKALKGAVIGIINKNRVYLNNRT